MLTFYWSPRSSATRIYWAIEELGIPCEKVRFDLQAGDQRKPEYLALNPNGKVPLIVDDGVPVFESMAILIHLGERYGQDKGLWPASGAKAHGQALAWVVWVAATVSPVMFRYMREKQESAKGELEKLIAMVEARLSKQPFMLGEQFTYVDLAVASAMGFWRMNGHDFSAYPCVGKWIDVCQSRPAFKAAMAAQQ
jgi:glutathione S-transferase